LPGKRRGGQFRKAVTGLNQNKKEGAHMSSGEANVYFGKGEKVALARREGGAREYKLLTEKSKLRFKPTIPNVIMREKGDLGKKERTKRFKGAHEGRGGVKVCNASSSAVEGRGH